ncbi:MAG: phenylpyruvate tautomerase MIF-related protein [Intestinibacillus sp.]
MPFISVNVTKPLSDAQKDAIMKGLGEKITLIPGKSEAALMIDVADGHAMYLAGTRRDALAYLDVKIYGSTEFEYKKAFTEAAFQVVAEATGIPADQMYLTFSQFENWGTKGTMK